MRDFGEIVKDKEIPWVRHWIDATFEFSKNFVKSGTTEIDFEALGREEWEFRKALKTKDFSNNERAKYLWNEALNIHNRNANNGKKSPGRPKKSPQDAPNGNAGVDTIDAGNGAASKLPTSCDQLKADGDTREDSLAKPDGSEITRNETRSIDAIEPSANHYATRQAKNGDASTREGEGDSVRRESGVVAPTTVSMNMRRVPQNEAPAHGFSGGRAAQGTMLRSPEASAQSGKSSALDSLPDKDGQSAKTRDTSESCRYAPPSCSPDDGNPADTAPSHGGSVASLEARQAMARESQRRAVANAQKCGRTSQSHSATARSAGPMPENKQAVYDFAASEGLDTADAYECWDVTVNERGGLTADGKPIKNWKAYVRKWCETRSCRRNQ